MACNLNSNNLIPLVKGKGGHITKLSLGQFSPAVKGTHLKLSQRCNRKLGSISKIITSSNLQSKQDILNYFKFQEDFPHLRAKCENSQPAGAFYVPSVIAKQTSVMSQNTDKNGPHQPLTTISTRTQDEMGQTSSEPANDHAVCSQNSPALEFVTLQHDRKELEDMKRRLSKADPDSMQYMFLSLEIRLKTDNLRLLERVNAVSLNTSNIKTTSEQVRVDLDEAIKSLESTQDTQDRQQVTIGNHAHSIQMLFDKISCLEGIVEKQAQELALLRDFNDKTIARGMKAQIYFHNIDECEEKDKKESNADTLTVLTNFCTNVLKVDKPVQFSKAVRDGSATPRSILATLTNPSDKATIYNCTSNLKGKVNAAKQPYVVSDKLPAGQQEQKRIQREITKRVGKIADGDKPTVSYKKGKLYLDKSPYVPTISVPKVSEIISPPNPEAIHAVQLKQGDTFKFEQCKFTGFSQEIKDTDDVKRGYIRMKQLHPKALHISMAYRLPGSDVDSEGVCDDGEHGCGRLILRLLSEWDILCRAVYVVRYYGGEHLGTKRFAYMTDAVRSCVARSSHNSITGEDQFPWHKQEEFDQKRAIRDRKSVRGRRTSTQQQHVTSSYKPTQVSPDKLYLQTLSSSQLTPRRQKSRVDPALKDKLVDENLTAQKQMWLRSQNSQHDPLAQVAVT